MSLIYVTGVSGSGKSTVLGELQARGLEAHGIDEEGLANWVNRETGQVEHWPEADKDFDIHNWFSSHSYELDDEKVKKLKEEADKSDHPIFLCGLADGDDKVLHYFTRVFALNADADTIAARVTSRENHDFGKTPEELERILAGQKTSQENYRKLGAVIIDAVKPIPDVVDAILASI